VLNAKSPLRGSVLPANLHRIYEQSDEPPKKLPEAKRARGTPPRRGKRAMDELSETERIEKIEGGHLVRGANGEVLVHVYCRATESEALEENVLTEEEARQLAIECRENVRTDEARLGIGVRQETDSAGGRGTATEPYGSRTITTLTGRCDMTSEMWPLPVVFPVSRKTPTSVEHLHIFDAFPARIGFQSQFLKLLALH
jgi:hypothetical protein